MTNVLLTGGAGYIGSHTAVALIERGYQPHLVDNFSNSSPGVLKRLATITGQSISCAHVDIRDEEAMTAILIDRRIDAVIHFAALKAVGESCENPLLYFDNNISGTIALLKAMQRSGVKRLVFSSSATVYGEPEQVPIPESAPLRVTNPYGRTKLVMEELINDVAAADPSFAPVILRYFNPVGAHPGGLIGEDPQGIPNNLMPYLCQVATGRRPFLRVFGNDYPTCDGTGVRDYLHVVDLARAHVAALEHLLRLGQGCTLNLGTGRGVSVLELVRAFEQASHRKIPLHFVARRAGDVAACYADPSRAQALLGWRAEYGIEQMCADAWRWQRENPSGYADDRE